MRPIEARAEARVAEAERERREVEEQSEQLKERYGQPEALIASLEKDLALAKKQKVRDAAEAQRASISPQ